MALTKLQRKLHKRGNQLRKYKLLDLYFKQKPGANGWIVLGALPQDGKYTPKFQKRTLFSSKANPVKAIKCETCKGAGQISESDYKAMQTKETKITKPTPVSIPVKVYVDKSIRGSGELVGRVPKANLRPLPKKTFSSLRSNNYR